MNATSVNAVLLQIAAQPRTKVVPVLVGAPGDGKTSFVTKLAAVLGRPLVVIVPSQTDAATIAGLPFIDTLDDGTKVSAQAPQEWAMAAAESGALVFVDEMNTGDRAMHAALMSLLLDRRAGGVCLDNCLFVAAMNPLDVATSSAAPVDPPLSNRLMHVDWPRDPERLVAYMLGDESWGITPIAPVSREEHAAMLAKFAAWVKGGDVPWATRDAMQTEAAWLSPRTLVAACALFAAKAKAPDVPSRDFVAALAALVGASAAAVMATWYDNHRYPTGVQILRGSHVLDVAEALPTFISLATEIEQRTLNGIALTDAEVARLVAALVTADAAGAGECIAQIGGVLRNAGLMRANDPRVTAIREIAMRAALAARSTAAAAARNA